MFYDPDTAAQIADLHTGLTPHRQQGNSQAFPRLDRGHHYAGAQWPGPELSAPLDTRGWDAELSINYLM